MDSRRKLEASWSREDGEEGYGKQLRMLLAVPAQSSLHIYQK
jgi:hypothetical protein